jgi:hypothetical protein
MVSGASLPSWNDVAHLSEASRTLWRQWPRLVLDNNVLKRRLESVNPFDGTVILQVVLPRKRRTEFIDLVHSSVTGGHLGRRRTEAGVSRRAY